MAKPRESLTITPVDDPGNPHFTIKGSTLAIKDALREGGAIWQDRQLYWLINGSTIPQSIQEAIGEVYGLYGLPKHPAAGKEVEPVVQPNPAPVLKEAKPETQNGGICSDCRVLTMKSLTLRDGGRRCADCDAKYLSRLVQADTKTKVQSGQTSIVYATRDIPWGIDKSATILAGTQGKVEAGGEGRISVTFEGFARPVPCDWDMITTIPPKQDKTDAWVKASNDAARKADAAFAEALDMSPVVHLAVEDPDVQKATNAFVKVASSGTFKSVEALVEEATPALPEQKIEPVVGRFKDIDHKACFSCGNKRRGMAARTIHVSTWKAITFHLCQRCMDQGHYWDELLQEKPQNDLVVEIEVIHELLNDYSEQIRQFINQTYAVKINNIVPHPTKPRRYAMSFDEPPHPELLRYLQDSFEQVESNGRVVVVGLPADFGKPTAPQLKVGQFVIHKVLRHKGVIASIYGAESAFVNVADQTGDSFSSTQYRLIDLEADDYKLPERQIEFMDAIRSKKAVKKNAATRGALRRYGMITNTKDWDKTELTPAGVGYLEHFWYSDFQVGDVIKVDSGLVGTIYNITSNDNLNARTEKGVGFSASRHGSILVKKAEPDYSIENRYGVEQGDDWMSWICCHQCGTYLDDEANREIALKNYTAKPLVVVLGLGHLCRDCLRAQIKPTVKPSEPQEAPKPAKPVSVPKPRKKPVKTPSEGKSRTTPLREQYLELKKQYPDCILFFRLGDFYETFDTDAEIIARECDLVLTGRPVNKSERVPMAGVPHHALEQYVNMLTSKGFAVAIAEQMTEPDGRGIVERKVVRIAKVDGMWLQDA